MKGVAAAKSKTALPAEVLPTTYKLEQVIKQYLKAAAATERTTTGSSETTAVQASPSGGKRFDL
jgi:hypothetical protein